MRASLLVPFVCSITTAIASDPKSEVSRLSPDHKWLVAWHCAGTWQPDSCHITASRTSDGKIFFTHHTSDRYINAVWSSDSSRCVLLDAPDNANWHLWLFRCKGGEVAIEELNCDAISRNIEAAMPATHRAPPLVTRSGIEKVEWISPSEFRLHILYNNTSVVVAVYVGEPSPLKYRVLPHNEI